MTTTVEIATEPLRTSIETIHGNKCTVIWHDGTAYENTLTWRPITHGYVLHDAHGTHCATALFALPENPKPSDAGLLYRYAAEGLTPILSGCMLPPLETARPISTPFVGYDPREGWDLDDPEITHALLADGTRGDVAIKGE